MFRQTQKIVLIALVVTALFAANALAAGTTLTKAEKARLNHISEVKASLKGDTEILAFEVPKKMRAIGKIRPTFDAAKNELTFTLPGSYIDAANQEVPALSSDIVKRATLTQTATKDVDVTLAIDPAYDLESQRLVFQPTNKGLRLHLPKYDGFEPTADATDEEESTFVAGTMGASGDKAKAIGDPIDLEKLFAQDQSGANATTDQTKTAAIGQGVPTLGSTLVKVLSALAIVLGLILLFAAAYKRFGKAGSMILPQRSAAQLSVVASLPVGLKKQISVVDIAGELLVLGLGEGEIRMLTRLENPEAIARLSKGKGAAAAGANGFNNALARQLEQYETIGADSPANDVPSLSGSDTERRFFDEDAINDVISKIQLPPRPEPQAPPARPRAEAPTPPTPPVAAGPSTVDSVRERLAGLRRL
ncbi:FliO/MopB family protein [bacterium]|nr:FliO/MopB family protein [bacterium]